jgi:hypothetical protein
MKHTIAKAFILTNFLISGTLCFGQYKSNIGTDNLDELFSPIKLPPVFLQNKQESLPYDSTLTMLQLPGVQNYSKEKRQYDSKGNLAKLTVYVWEEAKQIWHLAGVYSVLNTYDAQGRISAQRLFQGNYFYYNGDSSILKRNVRYTYDGGNIIKAQKTDSSFGNDKAWKIKTSTHDYTYDAQGRVLSWYNDIFDKPNLARFIFTYDADGFKSVAYTMQLNGSWLRGQMYTRKYDNGKLISVTHSGEPTRIDTFFRNDYIYLASGNVSSRMTWDYDNDTKTWNKSSSRHYFYTHDTLSYYVDSNFVTPGRTVTDYTRDINHRLNSITTTKSGSTTQRYVFVEDKPEAPSQIRLYTGDRTSYAIDWKDNSGDEEGFYIYRSTDGTNWTKVATLKEGVQTYDDKGLSASTVYYYKVAAYNILGENFSPKAATSIQESPYFSSINIYPNPAADHISIDLEPGIENPTIKLYDQTGKLHLQEILTGNNRSVNVSRLPQGAYILFVETPRSMNLGRVMIVR